MLWRGRDACDTWEKILIAGVVIGEAARVGDHVTLMQYVTLGGTGKETGDRHPKVLEYAQVAAHSTVLGAL